MGIERFAMLFRASFLLMEFAFGFLGRVYVGSGINELNYVLGV